MDIKTNKEELFISEVIFDGVQEQSVELDYVLPDYYPEIFKIVKCMTIPRIVDYSITDGKLTYEISVCIRVLYCSEENSCLHVIEQKMTYSKSVDLARQGISSPSVNIIPKCDYLNCRAVNQRRIDVRGAVSIKIKITDFSKKDVLCDAFGMGIQLKKTPLTYPSERLSASKQISVTEELDLGLSKPSVDNIIWYDAVVLSTDKKVIANKLVAKGEISFVILYTCTKDNEHSVESMQYTIPFSQIINLEGIDEKSECSVNADVLSCEAEAHSDGDGNQKIIECTINLMVKCSSYKNSAVEIATDEYSTEFASSAAAEEIKLEIPVMQINTSQVIKSSVENETIKCVYSSGCVINDCNVKTDTENNQLIISGNALFTVFANSKENLPLIIDKEDSFTINLPLESAAENITAEIKAVPVSCSYNLVADNTVEIKSEIKILGTVSEIAVMNCLTDIFIDESTPVKRDDNYALKLYFADGEEKIWDIAKKYCTSASAIAEENNLDSDEISGTEMLLIPIV